MYVKIKNGVNIKLTPHSVRHCSFYKTKEQVEQDKIKYLPCDYATLYAERHKDDMKGVRPMYL